MDKSERVTVDQEQTWEQTWEQQKATARTIHAQAIRAAHSSSADPPLVSKLSEQSAPSGYEEGATYEITSAIRYPKRGTPTVGIVLNEYFDQNPLDANLERQEERPKPIMQRATVRFRAINGGMVRVVISAGKYDSFKLNIIAGEFGHATELEYDSPEYDEYLSQADTYMSALPEEMLSDE